MIDPDPYSISYDKVQYLIRQEFALGRSLTDPKAMCIIEMPVTYTRILDWWDRFKLIHGRLIGSYTHDDPRRVCPNDLWLVRPWHALPAASALDGDNDDVLMVRR